MPARQFTLNERSKKIGASDIPVMLGMSKFRTPMELLHEKKGEAVPNQVGNAAVWGTYLEPFVCEMAEKEKGFKLRQVHKQVVHPAMDYFGCHLDRKISGTPTTNVEVKTLTTRTRSEWDSNENQLPDHYYMQVQAQMACDPKLTHTLVIGAILDSRELIYRWIPRDEETIEFIEVEVKYFWEECVHGISRPRNLRYDDYKDTYFSRESVDYVDSDGMGLLLEIANLKAQKSSLETEISRMEEKIAERMAAVDELQATDETWLARFRPMETKRLNVKRLREDHPDLCKDYTEVTEKRSLRLNLKAIRESYVVSNDRQPEAAQTLN